MERSVDEEMEKVLCQFKSVKTIPSDPTTTSYHLFVIQFFADEITSKNWFVYIQQVTCEI